MDEQLRELALVSHDVEYFEVLLKPSKELQPPAEIDYKVLADQLLECEWTLDRVVDIGEADLTRLFLRAGSGSMARSMDVDKGLHEAVHRGDVDHVRMFLQEFNADPNSFDEDARTPMYHLRFVYDDEQNSVTDNAVQIMKMLIDKGAKIVTASGNGYELQAHSILWGGTSEAVSIILDMDVIGLHERYRNGFTAVHYLAQNRHHNTLTQLQHRDFPVNALNSLSKTPLYIAVEFGVAEAVEFLLKKGADVNIADCFSSTPLSVATCLCTEEESIYMECILLLLEHGADVQARWVPYDDRRSTHTVFDELRRCVQRPRKVIMQHLALQTAIGTTITELVQHTIDSSATLKKQLDFDRQLLQRKIYGSLTLFSVLTCAGEKLISLMRNEQLAEKLWSHSDHLMSINSIYFNRRLQTRLKEAGQIVELRGKAAFVVGKLMGMDHNCQPVILDSVLRYLDLADLHTLVSFSL